MSDGNGPLGPAFLYQLCEVTEAAALAAHGWTGRGDKERGDGAAVDAMRAVLGNLPIDGTVIIGEGEKDEAPQLYNGEQVGLGSPNPAVDIAVDPIEGTTYMAQGLPNALATIAVAPRGTMFDPGPAFYMEKFAAAAPAKGQIDMAWPLVRKLERLADCLDKPVAELTIYVLDKPRHKELVADIRAAGARVALYSAGDVAGAIMAAIPGSGIDALMGTGGTPEGVMTACAIHGLGGEFLGRVDPQRDDEAAQVREAGLDVTRWYGLDELVASDRVYFCASGITPGLLVDGVDRTAEGDLVQTLMIDGARRRRQVLTSHRPAGT